MIFLPELTDIRLTNNKHSEVEALPEDQKLDVTGGEMVPCHHVLGWKKQMRLDSEIA